MPSRLRLPVLLANAVIFVVALALLVTGPAAEPTDPRLLDAPLTAPGEWFDSQRNVGADGVAYAEALSQARAARNRAKQADPELAGAQWELQGPTNVGGRVNDVTVDPERADTVFIAAASGGVWRSTDGAITFQQSWPADITQAIGALAQGSDGVLYAGTGEANPGGGSIVYGGTGMYRSADRGETWQHVGLSRSGAFGRIVVHPTNPNVVYAAASGNLYEPGGQRGLYRSTDGGRKWKRILAGDNDTTGAVDLSIDPRNPDNLLVSMWDHQRSPSHRTYAGHGSGVYRSTDGGKKWTRVAEVTMPDPAQNGRMGVAFSPADPDRAYAIIASTLAGGYGAMFRSDDGGATWEQLADDPTLKGNQSSFGWWFGRIYPDPDERERVFITGVELISSDNGARSFTPQSVSLVGLASPNQTAVHADQHAMVWDPKVPGRVYLGNDGGVYRSEADGQAGAWVGALEQGWTQHYSVDVGEKTPGYLVTGMQDNRCQRNAPAPANGRPDTWTSYGICGDGLQTLVNPVDETITYGCSQYGGCGRTKAGVPDLTFRKGPGDRYGWFAPLRFDPNNPSVMYFGSNIVSRSTDGGTSWKAISPDLTGNPDQADPNPGYRIRGVVTTVEAAAGDGQVLYAGSDTGLLWTTKDQGATWTQMDDPDLPGTWVTSVAIDPRDADVAYATYSGFRDGSDAAHVVRTTDGGVTWDNVSGDLPDAPANRIEVIGDALAVGTDVGVFVSRNGGRTWVPVGENLPTVPVLGLRWHDPTSTLTAATFGHGIQRVKLSLGN